VAAIFWDTRVAPYGILGRAMETSASFEARYAPLLYPTHQPDISNNVGSVKLFLRTSLRSLLRVFSFVVFFGPSVDDHGSPVIFRSVAVRPKHLSDPNFRP
jgi:hypothetical protein